MTHLFQPMRIGPLALANRIVVAPMCQYSAEDGRASDWHVIHLGTLALSGAGLLIVEATGVSPEARITPGDLGLYDAATEAALARTLASVRTYSKMPIAIQLAHAGRKASSRVPWEGGRQIPPDAPGGWRTVAPSAVPHEPGQIAPVALDRRGMDKVLGDFAAAARRAVRLGLDGIEVHGAHGYLLHEFLSPIANTRDDAYGGSLENRMRFPLEVFEAVRAAVPESVPVWIRLSASDWIEGGWDPTMTVAIARALERRGCAAIHVSSGGVSPDQKVAAGPDYQVPFAERIKREVGIPVIAVGLITEPAQAEAIVTQGRADAVALARAILYDPRWPWHAAAALGAQIQAPPQYWKSAPRGQERLFEGA